MRRAIIGAELLATGAIIGYLLVADTLVTIAAFFLPLSGFFAVLGAIGYVVGRKDSDA